MDDTHLKRAPPQRRRLIYPRCPTTLFFVRTAGDEVYFHRALVKHTLSLARLDIQSGELVLKCDMHRCDKLLRSFLSHFGRYFTARLNFHVAFLRDAALPGKGVREKMDWINVQMGRCTLI